jgi:malonyl-CoA O-methyltransferase
MPSSPADLAASFGRAASGYWRHAGVQFALADWLAEWLPEHRAGSALELGAGPGVFTRHLLPWAGPLVASDLSPEMCTAGRARYPAAIWRAQGARDAGGGPWDWIFSSSMLQWIAEPAEVFAAWRSALAPGGQILGGLFAAGSLAEWEELAGGTAPLRWRTPAEWRAAIQAAGLTLVRDQSERRTFRHASAVAFLRSLHGVGAAPAIQLPAARLRRLLQTYEQRHRDADGVIATWTFYRFQATSTACP